MSSIMGTVYAGLMRALIDMGVDADEAARTASTVCNWIHAQHAGERCTLPSARATRPDRIRHALSAGMSPEQVAKEHGCSVRTAYRALAKYRRSMGRQWWDLQVDAAQARRSSEG